MMPIALLALAIGAFGIGATEFAMIGVLPAVAHGLGVSIPEAGLLVSAYAAGVVIGAPLLTAVSGRYSRKTLLIAMMVLFSVGNLAAAAAPNYGFLLAARFVTALPHGAFFGVAAVVAAGMVDRKRGGQAVSLVFAGLTAATIVGVPAVTVLGNALSWRAPFVVIAGLGVVAVAAISLLVPADVENTAIRLRSELQVFRRVQVWLSLAVGVFGFGGVFAVYSYVAPTLSTLTGSGPGTVTVALALIGLGMTIGNLFGGRAADRALFPTLVWGLGFLGVVLGTFAFTAHLQIAALATLFALGVAAGIIIPAIQLRTIQAASGAPTLASASVQSGLNIANAAGAALGGTLIGAGFGYTAPSVGGAILALIGLALAIISRRKQQPEGGARQTASPVGGMV